MLDVLYLDNRLELRRVDGDVWLIIWRDYTHSYSGLNRAIRLVREGSRVTRIPEYIRGNEVFDIPVGWSYFVNNINDPNIHEVDPSEYLLGDLLIGDKGYDEILVIIDLYDDNEDVLVSRFLRTPPTWRALGI